MERGSPIGGFLLALLVSSAFLGFAAASPVITTDNVTQLRRIATLSVPNGLIADIFFSSDSGTMITWNLDGEVLVWARDTWEKRSFQSVQVPVTQIQAEMRTGPLYYGAAALSPDGQLIVTVDGGEAGRVVGRDLAGTELFSFTYGAPVFNLAFSSDGSRLAIGGLRPSIALFDVPSRTHTVDLTSDYEFVSGLAFSSDGSTLVAAYERPANVLKTWDLATVRETASFTHVTERIDYHAVLFSPSGREIVIATSESGTIRFFDLATHLEVRGIPGSSTTLYALDFSPDGTLLASAGSDVRLSTVDTGISRRILPTATETGTVAFSPDGTLLAFSTWEKGVEIRAVAP